MDLVLGRLFGAGRVPVGPRVGARLAAAVVPAGNISFLGPIDVDIEGELAQLGPTGNRPLRVRDTLS
ncbi:hypothetical protein [Micromonospora sp. NBC_00421]|uniref:hypothetical protein n=1 Tax=Micromonospora sp. NBC_00421 TaxID=2975976 RepID=UPI002E1BD0BE